MPSPFKCFKPKVFTVQDIRKFFVLKGRVDSSNSLSKPNVMKEDYTFADRGEEKKAMPRPDEKTDDELGPKEEHNTTDVPTETEKTEENEERNTSPREENCKQNNRDENKHDDFDNLKAEIVHSGVKRRRNIVFDEEDYCTPSKKKKTIAKEENEKKTLNFDSCSKKKRLRREEDSCGAVQADNHNV